MIGPGQNVWPHVHVDDIADLFIVVFDAVTANPDAPGHGWEGFYFGENGSYKYKELGEAIGKALVKVGKAKEETPTPFTKEEIDKYFAGVGSSASLQIEPWILTSFFQSEYLGSNSRCVANRGRALGWKPKHGTDDFYASVLPETEAILASGNLSLTGKL
jgi:nucleoside-diphosphate-sugar epimerase